MLRAIIVAATTTTGGPNLAVHGWEATLIVAGVLAVAIGAIYKLIKPVSHLALLILAAWPQIKKALPFVAQLPEVMPTLVKLAAAADALLALASDVKDLKERTERIEGKVEDLLANGRDTGRQP